jgi:hypothetical protein
MPKVRFRQADVKRALAAAKAAGLDIERVEIDAVGKIIVIVRGGAANVNDKPLDKWLADKNARAPQEH